MISTWRACGAHPTLTREAVTDEVRAQVTDRADMKPA